MARSAIPVIKAKETFVDVRYKLTAGLKAQIDAFGEFYKSQAGEKPEENDLVAAILQDYFDGNAEFRKYLKANEKPASGKKGGK